MPAAAAVNVAAPLSGKTNNCPGLLKIMPACDVSVRELLMEAPAPRVSDGVVNVTVPRLVLVADIEAAASTKLPVEIVTAPPVAPLPSVMLPLAPVVA